MNRVTTKLMLVLLMTATVGMSGCATTQQFEQLQADYQKVMERAASAEATANAAMNEAAAARAAAERAEQAALDAKRAAEATDEKIDRMFKKTMNK